MNFDLYGFGPALAAGALMTVKLALTALCLGLVLGLAGALAKTSPYKPLQWLGGTYSTIVRGVPELLWVLLIYFGTINAMRSLGELLDIPDLSLSAFAAGVIALGLCFGAYATEVLRGAIISIPKGHREAGVALGLSKFSYLYPVDHAADVAHRPAGAGQSVPDPDERYRAGHGHRPRGNHAPCADRRNRHQTAFSPFYMVAAFIYLGLTSLSMVAMHFLEQRAARGFVRTT